MAQFKVSRHRFRSLVLISLSSAAIAFTSLIVVPATSSAASWSQSFSDSFARPNGPIGGTWINSADQANVVGGQLNVAYNNGAPWVNATLRPASEDEVDQRVVISSAAGNSETTAGIFATLRFQGSSNNYWAGMYEGTVWLGSIQGGAQINFNGNGAALSSYSTSDAYSLDFSATGISPTTLTATVTDTTTSTVVGTATTTDGTSAMQQAGQSGMWSVTQTPWVVSSFTTYDLAADSYGLSGPLSDVAQTTSSNFTVTPHGNYTGTITPNDGGAGGTFTPSSLVFIGSSVPQTFTYVPISTGNTLISTTSSPALTDPAGLIVNVVAPSAGTILVTNPDLVWSPYNWQMNGSNWAQTSPGGAYVKLAFTGSTLGLGIDQSMLNGIDPSLMVLDAYVDGSRTPLVETFADATNGATQITFTTSLGAGNHYAVIYFSQSPLGVDRWTGPADALRVTSVQLASDGTGAILSPDATAVAQKPERVIFFGDSITEGYHDTSAESAYSADVANILGNVEYGQIAYSGAGWDVSAENNVPDFYVNSPNQATSSWENYDATASRLVDPSNLGAGFIGGSPDAVYLNMGINDADAAVPAADLATKLDAWLSDVRATIGPRSEIFVIVPFNFGSGNFPTYKAELLAGVSDYQSAHASDTRVDVIDLGVSAWDIVQANSTDNLHPDDAGALLLAQLIATASAPLISGLLQPGSLSPASSASSSTLDLATSVPTFGIAPYSYQWYRSTVPGFTPTPSTLIAGATQTTLLNTGLVPSTTYYYQVVYRDSTHPDQSVSSGQFAFTTTDLATSLLVPAIPFISNIPSIDMVGASFNAIVSTNGDGAVSVSSSTPSRCSVTGAVPVVVTFVSVGQCTLIAHVAQGVAYAGADGAAQSFAVSIANQTLLSQNALRLTSVKGSAGKNLTLTSSGGSGSGAVTYRVTSAGDAVCVITHLTTIRALRSGTCILIASKGADTTYLETNSPATVITFIANGIVAPSVATASFTYNSTVLSPSAKKYLRALLPKLTSSARLTVTGYAYTNWSLALSRAIRVETYMRSLVSHALHFTLAGVFTRSLRRVVVSVQQSN